jgi:hypothetical protein
MLMLPIALVIAANALAENPKTATPKSVPGRASHVVIATATIIAAEEIRFDQIKRSKRGMTRQHSMRNGRQMIEFY